MKRTVLLLTVLKLTLWAHTLWIDDARKVHRGHIGESSKVVPCESMSSALCMGKGGERKVDCNGAAREACDSLLFSLRPQYYTKTPYGTRMERKDRVDMAIYGWLSVESVKRRYADTTPRPFGKGLEIVLRNDLTDLSVGRKARLTILFDGKPIEGAVVANGHRVIGTSDSMGRINVKIRRGGLQNIKATIKRPCSGTDCDETVITTTLNFEVGQ